jgi:hypothetical protein
LPAPGNSLGGTPAHIREYRPDDEAAIVTRLAARGLIVHDRRVALPVEERLAIYELIALHGHLMDAGAFDRLDELFTDDFVYDLDALGYGRLEGTKALVDASTALGADNPLGHHVTNSLVIAEEDGLVGRARRGFGSAARAS